MATTGGSGLDPKTAEKFKKIIAMFDSSYTEEAGTAFRLLMNELQRKNVRFSDLLVDAEVADRLLERIREMEEAAAVSQWPPVNTEDDWVPRPGRGASSVDPLLANFYHPKPDKVMVWLREHLREMEIERAIRRRQPRSWKVRLFDTSVDIFETVYDFCNPVCCGYLIIAVGLLLLLLIWHVLAK